MTDLGYMYILLFGGPDGLEIAVAVEHHPACRRHVCHNQRHQRIADIVHTKLQQFEVSTLGVVELIG